MKIDLAPMEGLTDYTFRGVFNKYFSGVDRYYTPFISPTSTRYLTPRDYKEVALENNEGMHLIPQLLTNNAEVFTETCRELKEMGYTTVNLNLGCPSGTVTHKGKGAGFLKYPKQLREFLDYIYSHAVCDISIKTRIGTADKEEWEELLDIYKDFPINELIIHPRLLSDFYRGPVHTYAFKQALELLKCHVTYNGDITTVEKAEKIIEAFPDTFRIMIGRGLVADPNLASKIKGLECADRKTIKKFTSELTDAYIEKFHDERIAVNRMKSIWIYLAESFPGSEKALKQLKKAQNLVQYKSAVMQF